MGPEIYNFYKPPGPSSAHFLHFVKKYFPSSFLKIGHFGTLDPMACGILLVGHSGAQRLNSYIHSFPKTYLAVGNCQFSTSTGDKTGTFLKLTSKESLHQFFERGILKINEESPSFVGEYWQSPHAFSAAKFEGKKLYEWAIRGKTIVKEKQLRAIYHFSILRVRSPYILFQITVSSGTYVRSFFEDFCQRNHMEGHLVSLMRTAIGPFKVGDSLSLQSLKKRGLSYGDGHLPQRVITLDQVLLNELQAIRFINGAFVLFWEEEQGQNSKKEGQNVWVLDANGQSLGLGIWQKDQNTWALKPVINWPHARK